MYGQPQYEGSGRPALARGQRTDHGQQRALLAQAGKATVLESVRQGVCWETEKKVRPLRGTEGCARC